MKKEFVISNWKSDLEWIKISNFLKENITIYDRSEILKIGLILENFIIVLILEKISMICLDLL